MSVLRRNTAPQNVARARDLRKHMGPAERRLWYDGLAQRRLGFHFRRQYAFGPYFLDFYCTEARVCVEVDGEQHEFSEDYDARRDVWLAESGIVTLRFATDSVTTDLGTLLYKIKSTCESRTPTLPSPSGEGEAPGSEAGV